MKLNVCATAALCVWGGTAAGQVWSDNFDRPDGAVGADWTATSGSWAIAGNRCVHTSNGVNDILTHNSASASYQSTVTRLDVFRPTGTTASAFVGVFIGLGGTDSIMVKIQSQGTVANFSHIGIYHRTSATSWSSWTGTGTGFSPLTAQFASARMVVSFPDANTIKVELDTDFNGTPDQTYTKTGVSALAANFGMGHGLTGWMTAASMDNWSVNAGTPVCCVDFNNDMEIDFSDIEGFLNALVAMTPGNCAPGADFNNDGEFDFSDIEAFLALYNAGC